MKPPGVSGDSIYDATAYTSMLRASRQAARLLGENPTEYE